MSEADSIKQVVVVARKFPDGRGGTMGARTGKMIAQACHASIAFLLERVSQSSEVEIPPVAYQWMNNGQRKIALQVEDSDALVELHRIATGAGLESHLITDAGYTEFKGETITALAIGPDYSYRIDPITSGLRLM